MPRKKKSPVFNPRTTKKINNLSRAINKIDPALGNKVLFTEFRIEDIEPGINTIKYRKNGIAQEVRYDELENLSQIEQGSLLNELTIDRYNLRQERALEQLKVKGKISWQFKRSLEKDNPVLLQSINEFEDLIEGSDTAAIQKEFGDQDFLIAEDWEAEAESFFQGDNTPELFDFYRPGEAGGFAELNAFTWNSYKVLRGMI